MARERECERTANYSHCLARGCVKGRMQIKHGGGQRELGVHAGEWARGEG